MTAGPPPDTGIDAAILDRMTDTLIILQAKSATTDRGKVIAALQALRGRHPDAQVILVEGESDARVIRECLQSIERTSLGTPGARQTRAKATAERVADILLRHQELPESNDGTVPTTRDDRDEDATALVSAAERSTSELARQEADDESPSGSPLTGPADRLLTPAEVATLFRVDPKTITQWAKAGRLTSIRTAGGHRRYQESEVSSSCYRPAAGVSCRGPRV